MQNTAFAAIAAMVFGALLLGGCGDSNNTPGFGGGGTICASDDSEVGDTLTCPDSEVMIDFCVNTGNGSCYYEVGGEQVGCGNCFQDANLTQCAGDAIERCNN